MKWTKFEQNPKENEWFQSSSRSSGARYNVVRCFASCKNFLKLSLNCEKRTYLQKICVQKHQDLCKSIHCFYKSDKEESLIFTCHCKYLHEKSPIFHEALCKKFLPFFTPQKRSWANKHITIRKKGYHNFRVLLVTLTSSSEDFWKFINLN